MVVEQTAAQFPISRHPAAVGTADFVRAPCAQSDSSPHDSDAAEVLASEIVANAIMHARSEASLRFHPTAGVLPVEVGGDDPSHPRQATEDLDEADGQRQRTRAGRRDGRPVDGVRGADDPRRGSAGRRSGRWPPTPDTVPEARRLVTSALMSWQRLDVLESAELIVSELASNAVRHSRTEFVVTVEEFNGDVLLTVADACDALPRLLANQSHLGTGGRGLFLVDSLSSQWGATGDAGRGKTVWALLCGQRPA